MSAETRRKWAFVTLAVVCLMGGAAAVALALTGAAGKQSATKRAVAKARPSVSQILAGGGAFALFRDIDPDRPQQFGMLSIAPVEDGAAGERRVAGPACDRVAFRDGGGVCLSPTDGISFRAQVLGDDLRVTHEIRLAGTPSRVRVSPGGRWGGVTAFVQGHSYAQPGGFSTSATIIDMRSGKRVGQLERDFTVTHRRRTVISRDRNYWGLTFAPDGDTFYATLATGGATYLIRGSVKARTATTVRENVECPSLSPDGTRIAYKKAVGRAPGDHNPVLWRFTVLDLATGRETPLAETRSMDDQLEWLDDETLLYRDADESKAVAADGSGAPRRWLAAADSVVIVRPRGSVP